MLLTSRITCTTILDYTVHKGDSWMANCRFTESSDLVVCFFVLFSSVVSSENTESKLFANLSIPCIFLVS